VLKVEGSYEKRAALVIEAYGNAGKIPDFDLVRRIWVPQITIFRFAANGSREQKRTSTLPGYLLVEAILTEKLYSALKEPDLPHVFGWLQYEDSWPSQVSMSEIRTLAYIESFATSPLPRVTFGVGDLVAIPSLNVTGTVCSVSDVNAIVEIVIFRRKVPLEVPRELFSEMNRLE